MDEVERPPSRSAVSWTLISSFSDYTGKATLIIPSELAYGDVGSGPVPPAALLAFEVELIKVFTPAEIALGGETEVLMLPDGTKMTVPKGVKMRIVSNEEEESSSSAS